MYWGVVLVVLRHTFLFIVFDEIIIRNDLQKHHNPARFSCLNILGHTKSQFEAQSEWVLVLTSPTPIWVLKA